MEKYRLYVVRHAESLSNRGDFLANADTPLTEKGKIQSRKLGLFFKDRTLDFAFCSPYKRTKQTFDMILEFKKLDYVFDNLIVERKMGVFEGKPSIDFFKEARKLNLNGLTYRPSNGENFDDVLNRACMFKKKLFDTFKSKYKNILVVSHSGFLMSFIGCLFDKGAYYVSLFHLGNASVSRFDFDENFDVIDYEIGSLTHLVKY